MLLIYKYSKKRHRKQSNSASRWHRLLDKLLIKVLRFYRICAQDAAGGERQVWVHRMSELLHYLPMRGMVFSACFFLLRQAKHAQIKGIILPDRLKKFGKLTDKLTTYGA
jgi:hypothetical protein